MGPIKEMQIDRCTNAGCIKAQFFPHQKKLPLKGPPKEDREVFKSVYEVIT